jgi:xylulose-5-phosphate/fructose-6-phosphate phosphoketolase
VRGFKEQGTTTTPFDMVALNGMSRYHLCIEALKRTSRVGARAAMLTAECRTAIDQAAEYARAHFEDPPEIRDWVWGA